MKANDLTKFHEIRKQINITRKHHIKVGLPSDIGEYKDGTSILMVGASHEYGLGVPRRSFLRVPMQVKKNQINFAIKGAFKSILKGGDAILNLNKVGLIAQNISKSSFETQGFGKWKKLSKKTELEKGSSKILIDTGRLVQSVTYWVDK